MDPFDEISTGIPLNQIARTIEINLLQMLGEKEIPPPVQPYNNEYIL
jgi:putative membrane protein